MIRRKIKARKTKHNPKRHRRNPSRRHRRLRRNPDATDPLMAIAAASGSAAPATKVAGKKKHKSRAPKQSIAWRKHAKALRTSALTAPKRSVKRSSLTAQAHRYSVAARALSAHKLTKQSPLIKAMSIKSNPGLAGAVASLKILAPQAGVGAVAMVGLAMAGGKLSCAILCDSAGKMKPEYTTSKIAPYAPALATAGLSVVGYIVADKVAPRFKGAVVIGGLLAAAVQAIGALALAPGAPADGFAAKTMSALGLRAPGAPVAPTTAPAATSATAPASPAASTAVALKGGIFHGVGEYTTVGSMPLSSHALRPRNFGDDQMDLVSGLDDSTHFAPGEGGVLSGGIFR